MGLALFKSVQMSDWLDLNMESHDNTTCGCLETCESDTEGSIEGLWTLHSKNAKQLGVKAVFCVGHSTGESDVKVVGD